MVMLARSVLPWVTMLLVISSVRCHWHRDWDRAKEFQSSLQCGMSTAQVQELAKQFGADEFAKPQMAGLPGIPDYYVKANERVISLWFHGGGLAAYMSGIASMEHDEQEASPRVELCASSLQ